MTPPSPALLRSLCFGMLQPIGTVEPNDLRAFLIDKHLKCCEHAMCQLYLFMPLLQIMTVNDSIDSDTYFSCRKVRAKVDWTANCILVTVDSNTV